MHKHVANHSPEGLLQAFAATHYLARIDGSEYVIRAGRAHETLDAALAARPWAVLTAFNPRARRSDDETNLVRHRQLLDTVADRGWESHPAVNRDPEGIWPDETSLLVVDARPDALDAIAEAFDQAAIVTGRNSEPARLRLYGATWPQPLPCWAQRAS